MPRPTLLVLALSVLFPAWAPAEIARPAVEPRVQERSAPPRALAETYPNALRRPPHHSENASARRSSAGPALAPDMNLEPAVTPPGPLQRGALRQRGRAEENSSSDGRSPSTPAPPVKLPTRTDADVRELWTRWRRAIAEGAGPRAEEAAAELLAAKSELGVSDLESFSVAASRLAVRRYSADQPVEAIETARLAVDLAPGLPSSRFTLAKLYFFSEPSAVARWADELRESLLALVSDPRHFRPVRADASTAALAALVATAVAAITVLFLRRVRCFLHDFHHLFPRAAARWQTAPLAVLLLSLPWVFRLGLVPVLAVLLASVTLYLDWRERVVGATLLAALGLVPPLARAVTEGNSMAGTVAEDVRDLDRGGLEAAAAAQSVKARIAEQRADFAELYALGRYALRRGRLEEASDLFKRAALQRVNHPYLLTALGNARFGAGDLEGALGMYAQAREADPTLAAAHYNLARVHERKARKLTGADQALEMEEALTDRAHAIERDPSLGARLEPSPDETRFNQLVLTPELPWEEVRALAVLPEAAERVGNQLSWWLVGTNVAGWTLIVPLALALLVLGVGALRPFVSASDLCEKCGRAGCPRCDPELARGGGVCSQCVHVFTRRSVVAPHVKVRKQLEVNRFEVRRAQVSWLLGIACSGGGHLFNGRPVRGALFAFAALFFVAMAALGEGILRAPYGEFPLVLRLAPVVVAFAVVYLLSLRSLRRARPL